MKILDDWINDLPFQFQDKKNINILLKAFSRQMEEVKKMFEQLNSLTDIDDAEGQNLDYVGTIIPLSRAEASRFIGSNKIINDETYRVILKSKLMRNVNNCTYYDLQKTIEKLGSTGKYKYEEVFPAGITLKANESDLTPNDRWLYFYPLDKAAGVGLKLFNISNVKNIFRVGLLRQDKEKINIYPANLVQESISSDYYFGTATGITEEIELRGK